MLLSLCLSMILFSLELWYYTAVIIMVGCLKNPHIQVDAISIWLAPTHLDVLCRSLISDIIFAFSLNMTA